MEIYLVVVYIAVFINVFSPSALVIPLADYYIIAGVIYQAPDLGSVINSRVVSVFTLFKH